ncbi:MAG: hypothetical protein P4L64_14130, partial [Caulobacteraceae bacterium]|nr:hypothetical protein [Caulobacteraceae bacterium]
RPATPLATAPWGRRASRAATLTPDSYTTSRDTIQLANRLDEIREERQQRLRWITVTNQQLVSAGVRLDVAEPGAIDLGFLMPRALFHNALKDFGEELRRIDAIVEAFSRLATGETQRAQLLTVNTSTPLAFIKVDPDTVRAIIHAFRVTIDIVKTILTLKQGIEAIRALLAPKIVSTAIEEAEMRQSEAIREAVKAHLAESHEVRSESDSHELEIVLTHAYGELARQISGGLEIKIRTSLDAQIDPTKLGLLSDIVAAVNELKFPELPPAATQKLVDERVGEAKDIE